MQNPPPSDSRAFGLAFTAQPGETGIDAFRRARDVSDFHSLGCAAGPSGRPLLIIEDRFQPGTYYLRPNTEVAGSAELWAGLCRAYGSGPPAKKSAPPKKRKRRNEVDPDQLVLDLFSVRKATDAFLAALHDPPKAPDHLDVVGETRESMRETIRRQIGIAVTNSGRTWHDIWLEAYAVFYQETGVMVTEESAKLGYKHHLDLIFTRQDWADKLMAVIFRLNRLYSGAVAAGGCPS